MIQEFSLLKMNWHKAVAIIGAGTTLGLMAISLYSGFPTMPAAEPPKDTSPPIRELNIRVFEPMPNQEVGLPFMIRGEARVFENMFSWQIVDENGDVLVEEPAYANSPDVGEFGPFVIRASYPKPKGARGQVEVFQYSAKDGSVVDRVTIPVRFKPIERTTLKVFFSNISEDPNTLHCEKVYPLTRNIEKTAAPARAALGELLAGLTFKEEASGFKTNIPAGVAIRSLLVENGVARVDFSNALRVGGGSCLVSAIRAQIEETLKQFPTVKNVIIAIEGDEHAIEP